MEKVVLDSYVWLSYLLVDGSFAKAEKVLQEIFTGKKEGYISAVNYGEVIYMTWRKRNEVMAKQAEEMMKNFPVIVVEPNLDDCINASYYKAKNTMSYADAFAASLTQRLDAILITGDPEFKPLKGKIKIQFI